MLGNFSVNWPHGFVKMVLLPFFYVYVFGMSLCVTHVVICLYFIMHLKAMNMFDIK